MQPDYLNDLLTEVLACACETLNAGESDCECPCRLFVVAGPPVWDLEACCSDGQLSANIERIYTFGNFPVQATGVNLCQAPLAVDIAVTLLRCFPTIKDDGSSPSSTEIESASQAVYRDMYLLVNGLLCCLQRQGRRRKFIFRGARVVGPQGGCIGTELTFTIEISDPIG